MLVDENFKQRLRPAFFSDDPDFDYSDGDHGYEFF